MQHGIISPENLHAKVLMAMLIHDDQFVYL